MKYSRPICILHSGCGVVETSLVGIVAKLAGGSPTSTVEITVSCDIATTSCSLLVSVN